MGYGVNERVVVDDDGRFIQRTECLGHGQLPGAWEAVDPHKRGHGQDLG